MYYVIHVETVNSVSVASVGDLRDKTYNYFQSTGLRLLANRPSSTYPKAKYFGKGVNDGDADSVLKEEGEHLDAHEQVSELQQHVNEPWVFGPHVSHILPNGYDFQNDILEP